MQKIIPHLWFDKQAEEAAHFYTSLFKDSKIGSIVRYGKAGFEIHKQPEGKVMTVEFELAGQKFVGLNGGPIFKFTPAISFLISCDTKEEVDAFWKPLSEGGTALMELGSYPFSDHYGWIQDKYGVSWQIMLTNQHKVTQKITPTLMYVGDQCGKAEEAINLYTSVFKNSKVDHFMRYEKTDAPDKEGTIKHGGFTLDGQDFAAMDSAYDHKFTFNEAISLMVSCKDQEEIDYFWEKLSQGGDPKSQECGWLKDRYGLSWQIVPERLSEMLRDLDHNKTEQVMTVLLKMKKIQIAELEKALQGTS